MDLSQTQRLSTKVVKVWRVTALIVTLIVTVFVAIGALAAIGLADLSIAFILVPIVLFVVLIIVFVIIVPAIRYRRFSFIISNDEIVIKHGIFIITHTVVPMIKIQYTDTTQGPIMRAFSLAALKAMTAGGTVEIPGLPIKEAETLRDQITELVKTVKENV